MWGGSTTVISAGSYGSALIFCDSASIFGMNVRLPFQNFEYGFWVVMGIMVLVAGAAVYIFWKRHWF